MTPGTSILAMTFTRPPRVAGRSRCRPGIRASDAGLEAHGRTVLRCGLDRVPTAAPGAAAWGHLSAQTAAGCKYAMEARENHPRFRKPPLSKLFVAIQGETLEFFQPPARTSVAGRSPNCEVTLGHFGFGSPSGPKITWVVPSRCGVLSWYRTLPWRVRDRRSRIWTLSAGNVIVSLSFYIGAPETIRTSDLPLRRRLLYPAELPGNYNLSKI